MPNSAATRSKRAMATSPQLSAPTTTSTAATTSICFMTSSCAGPFPTLSLNIMQINLHEIKIRPFAESRVSVTTKPPRNLNCQEKREGAMLSTTLQDGLNDYEIGAKIRALRLKKKMGLVELGSTRDCRPRCSRRSNAAVCSPRYRPCCGSRSSSASASSSSSPARATSRSSRCAEDASAWNSPSGPARARRLSVRVARLPGNRASVQRYYAEFLPVAPEKRGPHAPRRRRVHLRDEGNAEHADRDRRTRARCRRCDLLRFDHSSRLRPRRRARAAPSS